MIGGSGALPHFYRRQGRDFVVELVGGGGVGGVRALKQP